MKMIKELFQGRKATYIIVISGVIGILLILCSQFATALTPRTPDPVPASKSEISTDDYTTQLEQRLGDIIGSIHGVGKLKIMITLYQGTENVYAKELKSSYDSYKDITGDAANKTQEKNDLSEEYLLVENADGRHQALLTTQIEPKVKGVIVVCDGAENAIVAEQVTSAVTTALDIPAHRVCVIKLSESF